MNKDQTNKQLCSNLPNLTLYLPSPVLGRQRTTPSPSPSSSSLPLFEIKTGCAWDLLTPTYLFFSLSLSLYPFSLFHCFLPSPSLYYPSFFSLTLLFLFPLPISPFSSIIFSRLRLLSPLLPLPSFSYLSFFFPLLFFSPPSLFSSLHSPPLYFTCVSSLFFSLFLSLLAHLFLIH